MEFRKVTFTVPSGYKYTIREQNGADDDVISNPAEASTLKNLSRFIAGIVEDTDYTSNGKLTVEQAHNMPVLDKYCIILHSRIFSFGNEFEFDYNWGENGGIVHYTQDLNEFIFDDYANKDPEYLENIIRTKPLAIPFYPLEKQTKDIKLTLASGIEVMFDLLTGNSESYILNLPLEKRTKNQELIARNLRMKIDDKWEKVENFRLFSVKDMSQLRKEVAMVDPIYQGNTIIENPHVTGMTAEVNILGMEGFFFPVEI